MVGSLLQFDPHQGLFVQLTGIVANGLSRQLFSSGEVLSCGSGESQIVQGSKLGWVAFPNFGPQLLGLTPPPLTRRSISSSDFGTTGQQIRNL